MITVNPSTGVPTARHYYHANRLGSVIALADQAGVRGDRHVYTPYGVETDGDETGNPFRYTGRRYDPESELYYYRARYYWPEIGRFLQTDPIGYADQMNLYAYVGNNPLNATDPSGMQSDNGAFEAAPRMLLPIDFETVSSGSAADSAASNAGRYDDPNAQAAGISRALGASNHAFGSPEADNSVGMSGVSMVNAQMRFSANLPILAVSVAGGGAGGQVVKSSAVRVGQFTFRGTTSTLRVSSTIQSFFRNGAAPRATDLARWARNQGWTRSQTSNGPLKFIDGNGIERLVIKRGSSRAPGSDSPHVAIRNASGQRIDPVTGDPTTRRGVGNHRPIVYDLE